MNRAYSMHRASVAILLAVVLFAGCSGLPGNSASADSDGAGVAGGTATPDDGSVPAEAGASESDTGSNDASDADDATGADGDEADSGTVTPAGTADAGSVQTVADEHPYVTDGRLDARALARVHLEVLGGAESFTLTNNGTVTYASNGTAATRITDVRRFGLASERLLIERRSATPDGTVQGESSRFDNGTATCTRYAGEAGCSEGGFDRRRAVGLAMETTSLETLAGPAFAPDGTVERDGRALYRYSATSLRSDLGESTRSELGPNASLESATLLVAPDGRIVEYRFAIERDDGDGDRLILERTYRTRGVNATTVTRPSWVPS